MNRPHTRAESSTNYSRNRPAPPALVSLALALVIPALVVAVLLPSPAAFVTGAALGALLARR